VLLSGNGGWANWNGKVFFHRLVVWNLDGEAWKSYLVRMVADLRLPLQTILVAVSL